MDSPGRPPWLSHSSWTMMLPAQHTTFNTLDNWAINPPPNQKGKGPERNGYRVMARNMYTIHSVTLCYSDTEITFTDRVCVSVCVLVATPGAAICTLVIIGANPATWKDCMRHGTCVSVFIFLTPAQGSVHWHITHTVSIFVCGFSPQFLVLFTSFPCTCFLCH